MKQREAKVSPKVLDLFTLLRIADKQLTRNFSLWLSQLFPLNILFHKESALVYILVHYFALYVVFSLCEGSVWTVMSHTVFSCTRCRTVTLGPQKAPSLKASTVPSLVFKIKSITPSDPTVGKPASGSWKRTFVWELY